MLYIAVDFDRTITEDSISIKGKSEESFRKDVVKLLNNLVDQGHFVYLYSCRSDEKYLEAVNRCKKESLRIDYEYGRNCIGKPFYDILLDDRAMSINTFMTLYSLVDLSGENTNSCPKEVIESMTRELKNYNKYE